MSLSITIRDWVAFLLLLIVFYNAGWIEDLTTIVNYLHQEHPKAPLFAVGTSIGANILLNLRKNPLKLRKFSEQFARRSGTYFCSDKTVTAVVIKGLADHKDSLGAPLCPCRHYDDKEAEVGQGFWNCPCVPMRERKECHCMLFLTPDNDFAGKDQTICMEEIKEATSKI